MRVATRAAVRRSIDEGGTACHTPPMTFETLDFLTDSSVLGDPSQYYDYLRESPVRHVPPHDVVAVTGYDELVSVFRDVDLYSMCNTASGPFPPLPIEDGAADVTDVIEANREIFP